ncbi:MAG: nickel-dependent lactate racemase [Candidatus Binatia bacterium]|nr:nickel-dependent lactate racemase [Candidatus Binatia bacterium]
MKVRLAFGRTGVEIELPSHVRATVLQAKFAEAAGAADEVVAAALRRPLASPPLRDLARGKKRVAIAVCDITRPAPNRTVLPHVLATLEQAGVPRAGVTILIATGLHRAATLQELHEIVGPEVLARYTVVSHNARDAAAHCDLGTTRSGTRVLIDRRFVESDLRLSLGFIEPHLMLGFSGGRKLVAPGLAGEETIKRLHSPFFMRNPRVVEGSFVENPLHHELLEIARMARHDFIIDVALTRSRQIAGVFAGDPEIAHAAGVEFVRQSTLALLDEPVDAVITTSAGYPLDLTYYQSVKGVTAASHIVKPGGAILLIAACHEGLGSAEFAGLVRRFPDPQTCLASTADEPVVIDQWQLEKLALVAQKARLSFCTPGIAAADRAFLWGPVFTEPQRAVDALCAELARGATVAVIPEGPYVFAQLRRTESHAGL